MGWNERNGYEAVERWLRLATSQHQSTALVAGQNDLLAVGARRFFAERTSGDTRDRWMSLPFIGVDGLEEGGRRWVEKGVLAATVIVPQTAATAIDVLASSMQSGCPPDEMIVLTPKSWPDLEQLAPRRIV
jgi:hypothetical protein